MDERQREEALCRLMAQWKDDLMRMCCMMLQDHALAEDAVQETFVKAYQALPRFRGECSEKTWLMRIAVNTCRSYRRSWWNRMVDKSLPEEVWNAFPAAQNEELMLLEDVLRLPEKEKTTILLYYYQHMSCRETAQALGIGVAAVSMRLKKAREKLRILLMEGGDA